MKRRCHKGTSLNFPPSTADLLEFLQISQVMTDLLTPVVNKVHGFYFKGLTALVNKPPNMQIFAPSKFGINRSTDLSISIHTVTYNGLR